MKLSLPSFSLFIFLFALPVAAQEAAPETSSPKIILLAPYNGQEFLADEPVTLQFTTQNFLFVDFKSNKEPFPGNPNAGHGHLWIDSPATCHDTNLPKILSTDPIVLGALEPGEHTLMIELMQNHGVCYDPPVRASVTFSVVKPPAFEGAGEALGLGGGSSALSAIVFGVVLAIGVWFGYRRGLWHRLLEQLGSQSLQKPGGRKREVGKSVISKIAEEEEEPSEQK